MNNKTVYEKAVVKLFQKIGGGIGDRDVTVAVELFDLLLERDKSIHPDTLNELCKEAGFDDFTRDKLAQIYDSVDEYKEYKGRTFRYWTDELIDDLLK